MTITTAFAALALLVGMAVLAAVAVVPLLLDHKAGSAGADATVAPLPKRPAAGAGGATLAA